MLTSVFIWLQHILPQHAVSRLAGAAARSERPWLRRILIGCFIKAYNVNMAEAERGQDEYRNFNYFFSRALKPHARPLANPMRDVLCPADGTISQLGKIDNGRIIQAKGQSYTAEELLGSDAITAQRFTGGNFATIYLSPRDYHRVHMPVRGRLEKTTYIPGDLFSVNTVTADNVPRLFARNERLSCIFDTSVGKVASVMVGAMIVASIETVWSGLIPPHGKHVITKTYPYDDQPAPELYAGDEMGRFLLGSTVILLFEAGTMHWSPHMMPGTAVRMGQAMGHWQ